MDDLKQEAAKRILAVFEKYIAEHTQSDQISAFQGNGICVYRLCKGLSRVFQAAVYGRKGRVRYVDGQLDSKVYDGNAPAHAVLLSSDRNGNSDGDVGLRSRVCNDDCHKIHSMGRTKRQRDAYGRVRRAETSLPSQLKAFAILNITGSEKDVRNIQFDKNVRIQPKAVGGQSVTHGFGQ